MRISDWSSDVCSSDLTDLPLGRRTAVYGGTWMPEQSENRPLTGKAVTYKGSGGYEVIQFLERAVRAPAADEVRIEVKAAAVNPTDLLLREIGRASCRERVCQYGGDLGGRRFIKK